MADFAALNTALSALYDSRRAIEVTGQNLANVNTEGYSRQRVDLQANQGPVLPALFSRWPGGGAGVTVAGVVRLRDDLLDARAQREHGVQARTTATQTTYAYLEQTLTEPSDNGLQQQLSEFWDGWDDVGNHPDEPAPRSELVQRATTLASGFNQAAEAMAAQWDTARGELGAIVDDVNATAKNIAALNDSIKTATVAGNSPNELTDRRDALVLHLADLVGATARPGESGTVDVSLGGSPLVTGARSEALAVSGAATFADVTATPVTVTWSADGSQAAVGDGQAAGLLDALDVVLPGYRTGLDAVANAVASTVNIAQAAGYDSAGNRGTDFFGGTTAASLRVAVTDVAKVAASGIPPHPTRSPVPSSTAPTRTRWPRRRAREAGRTSCTGSSSSVSGSTRRPRTGGPTSRSRSPRRPTRPAPRCRGSTWTRRWPTWSPSSTPTRGRPST